MGQRVEEKGKYICAPELAEDFAALVAVERRREFIGGLQNVW